MIPLTALLCAQSLYVERFELPVAMPEWNTGAFDTHGGTYLYSQSEAAGRFGAGIVFTKTDAGTGGFITPTFLGHDFMPPRLGNAYVRYWIRYRHRSGPPYLWPVQIHNVNPFGTVAELIVGPAPDGGDHLVLQGSGAGGFTMGPNLPIWPDAWHLLQLELEGLGTDAGRLVGALDGRLIGALPFDWTGARLSRYLLGFGAVHDRWLGEIAIDDLVTLTERRAAFAQLTAPQRADVGRCTPASLTFHDLDGGLLAPPDFSPIYLRSDAGVQFFRDGACSAAWNDGLLVATAQQAIAFRPVVAGPQPLTVLSPDLIGDEALIIAVDAGPTDAGLEPADAGAPDAGLSPDAGSPPTLRDYGVGCGCTASPALAVLISLAVLRVTARRRRTSR
mgnify:CR=1 FL=1